MSLKFKTCRSKHGFSNDWAIKCHALTIKRLYQSFICKNVHILPLQYYFMQIYNNISYRPLPVLSYIQVKISFTNLKTVENKVK